MKSSANSSCNDSVESAPVADAGIADILPAWQQFFSAKLENIVKGGELVEAELKLSVKATVLCASIVLVLFGLGLICWTAFCASVGYAMYLSGMHWLIIPATIIGLNLLAIMGSVLQLKRFKSYVSFAKTKNMLSSNSL